LPSNRIRRGDLHASERQGTLASGRSVVLRSSLRSLLTSLTLDHMLPEKTFPPASNKVKYIIIATLEEIFDNPSVEVVKNLRACWLSWAASILPALSSDSDLSITRLSARGPKHHARLLLQPHT
jgi:hypothetical protein